MKLCFYAPVKNESRYIGTFITTHLKEMTSEDCFVFVDTGSEDSTIDIIKSHQKNGVNIKLYTKCPEKAKHDFSTMRNYALSKVPSDYNIGIALDIDEILRAGWRKQLEEVFETNPFCILEHTRYEDTSEETKIKNNFFLQPRQSIHSISSDIKWIYPIHECLYSSNANCKLVKFPKLVSIHLRNTQKSRPNLTLMLEEYLKKKPKLTETQINHLNYVMGNQYYNDCRYKEAIGYYEKYINYSQKYEFLQPGQSIDESFKNHYCETCVKMGNIFNHLNDDYYERIYRHLAYAVKPCRETCLYMVNYMIKNKNKDVARAFLKESLTYTKEQSYRMTSIVWTDEYIKRISDVIEKM